MNVAFSSKEKLTKAKEIREDLRDTINNATSICRGVEMSKEKKQETLGLIKNLEIHVSQLDCIIQPLEEEVQNQQIDDSLEEASQSLSDANAAMAKYGLFDYLPKHWLP